MPVWTRRSPQRQSLRPFSYDQAFSFVPAARRGSILAEANAFGSNENLINHARNIGHRLEPRLLAHHAQPGHLGYDRIFDYIASQGNFTCASAKLGIPGADLGCSARRYPQPGGSIQSRLGFH
jgi:hypothetical protein